MPGNESSQITQTNAPRALALMVWSAPRCRRYHGNGGYITLILDLGVLGVCSEQAGSWTVRNDLVSLMLDKWIHLYTEMNDKPM